MRSVQTNLSRRADELRREFDRSFASPPILAREATVDLLAIEVGMNRHAIQLAEIAGLYTDKKITRVPGSKPAMIGIAGFRGTIAPVYDFASLMGYPPSQAPRCMIVMATAPIAFAFDAFDGQQRVSRESIRPRQPGDAPHGYARDLVQYGNDLISIIDLGALMTAVKT
jgi:chemotaxis signal transduction protein